MKKSHSKIISGLAAKTYNLRNSLNGLQFVINRAIKLVDVKPGQKLLDIGCGTGNILIQLAKQHPHAKLFGIDPSVEMIKIAQANADEKNAIINLSVSLGEQINFPDESFDWIVSSLAMHHVSLETKQRIISEAYRLLKPNGSFLITDFGEPTNWLGKFQAIFYKGHAFIHENFTGELAMITQRSKFKPVSNQVQFGFVHHTILTK